MSIFEVSQKIFTLMLKGLKFLKAIQAEATYLKKFYNTWTNNMV